jgi:hypothetical protein
MNKRFFVVIFLALVAVGLGVFFSLRQNPLQQPAAPVVRYAERPPAVVNVLDAPTNITVSFVGEIPAFPNSLPVYSFSNPVYSNEDLNRIARSLGFASPPTKLVYGKETRMLWKTDVSNLSLNTNTQVQSWSYDLFQSKTKPSATQPLVDSARKFIELTFFSGETTGLVLQREMTTPIEHIQIAEVPRPTLRGYLFIKQTPNLYDIVSKNFSAPSFSVVIDQFGITRRASFVVPPTLGQEQTISIISIDDAVKSINKGLGVLVSITKEGGSYWEKTPQFTTVLLSDAQLVYYPNQTTLLLTPFYVFRGVATTTAGIGVDVAYAVSAIEQSN